MSSESTTSNNARLKNDYGADYWVRNKDAKPRHAAAGRGLFSGLQDVKSYNVDQGWARRKATEEPGLFESLWNRFTGGGR